MSVVRDSQEVTAVAMAERRPVREAASCDAWLQWFVAHKATQCRAYLCATYGLDGLDAEALMNTAFLQVFCHWETLQTPLAYFWTTLRRAVQQHLRRRTKDRRGQEAYALAQQFQANIAACTAHQVAAILDLASPRQRQLLGWFVQGYEDTQVATHLGTTPHAIRQARYATYMALRKRLSAAPGCGPDGSPGDGPPAARPGGRRPTDPPAGAPLFFAPP